MTFNIAIVPASTQAGKEVIRALLGETRQLSVQAIYRNASKAPLEFTKHSNFSVVEGDVTKGIGLDFADSDAVFYVPPPVYDGTDTAENAQKAADNMKAALQKSKSVKRLVVFSAYGAEHSKGIGSLVMNHVSDVTLGDSVPEVVIARTGWFMENWVSAFETIKTVSPFFESFITPLDHKIAMISLQDVGNIIAKQLLETGQPLPTTPHIINLHGPQTYGAQDVRDALESITGKRIKVVGIEPTQLYDYYLRSVSSAYARELEEMTNSMLPGSSIHNAMKLSENVERGTTELVESLRKIASGETVKAPSGAF